MFLSTLFELREYLLNIFMRRVFYYRSLVKCPIPLAHILLNSKFLEVTCVVIANVVDRSIVIANVVDRSIANEEDPEAEAEDDVPPPATPPNEALEMPPVGSTYKVGGPSSVTQFPPFYLHGSEIARLDGNTELLLSNVQYLERYEKKRKIDNETCSTEIREGKKRMDKMEQGLGDEMQFNNKVEHRVTDLENMEQERDEEMVKVKKRLGTLKANYSLVLSERDEWRIAFFNMQALVFERLGWGAWDARPDVGNDRHVSFVEPKPPKPPGSPSSSH
nr:hypothetical protein [Tanacetum cinerariifolium]